MTERVQGLTILTALLLFGSVADAEQTRVRWAKPEANQHLHNIKARIDAVVQQPWVSAEGSARVHEAHSMVKMVTGGSWWRAAVWRDKAHPHLGDSMSVEFKGVQKITAAERTGAKHTLSVNTSLANGRVHSNTQAFMAHSRGGYSLGFAVEGLFPGIPGRRVRRYEERLIKSSDAKFVHEITTARSQDMGVLRPMTPEAIGKNAAKVDGYDAALNAIKAIDLNGVSPQLGRRLEALTRQVRSLEFKHTSQSMRTAKGMVLTFGDKSTFEILAEPNSSTTFSLTQAHRGTTLHVQSMDGVASFVYETLRKNPKSASRMRTKVVEVPQVEFSSEQGWKVDRVDVSRTMINNDPKKVRGLPKI